MKKQALNIVIGILMVANIALTAGQRYYQCELIGIKYFDKHGNSYFQEWNQHGRSWSQAGFFVGWKGQKAKKENSYVIVGGVKCPYVKHEPNRYVLYQCEDNDTYVIAFVNNELLFGFGSKKTMRENWYYCQ